MDKHIHKQQKAIFSRRISQPANTPENKALSKTCGPESGPVYPDLQLVAGNHKTIDNRHQAHNAESVLARRWALSAQKDARLGALIDAWPGLPEHVRSAILTLCQLPSGTGGGL